MRTCPTCGGQYEEMLGGLVRLHSDGWVVTRGKKSVALTQKEYLVMRAFVLVNGRTLTVEDVYGEVYGVLKRDPRSVVKIIQRLNDKIEALQLRVINRFGGRYYVKIGDA